MLSLPKTKPVELSTLTSEMKAVVPSLEGLSDGGAMLDIRRLTGDFTPAETTLITQALAAHDALALQQAEAAREAFEAAEKAKDPKTLSDKERLTRLELLLGVD